MKISINSNYFRARRLGQPPRSYCEAALLCKNAGFDSIDFSCSSAFCAADDWETQAKQLAEDFSKNGIVVDQTHAPFNRYAREENAIFREKLRRAFETSAILGAKRIIVHADEYVAPDGKYNSEDACKFAYDYFAPYVELAKKRQIGVAVENLFEDGRCGENRRSRCTSEVDELITIIDSFRDPAVTCCWDFGHAAVAFGDKMLEELKKIGTRLSSTHIHDNCYGNDAHLPLFFGKIDWESHIEYLRSIGYDGAFTYEFVYGCIPDALLPEYLKLAYQTANYIINI